MADSTPAARAYAEGLTVGWQHANDAADNPDALRHPGPEAVPEWILHDDEREALSARFYAGTRDGRAAFDAGRPAPVAASA